MRKDALRLLKPLRVIQLGLESRAQLEELPSGAEVCILREVRRGDCIDIACGNKRYFALKSELLCHSQSAIRRSTKKYG